MIVRTFAKLSLLGGVMLLFIAVTDSLPLTPVWQGLLLNLLPISALLFWLGLSWNIRPKFLIAQFFLYAFSRYLFFVAAGWRIGVPPIWLYHPFTVTIAHASIILATIVLRASWRWWNRKRQQSLIWSLTHTHITVAALITAPMILIIALQRANSLAAQFSAPSSLPPLTHRAEYLIIVAMPTVLFLCGFAIIGLIALFPFSLLCTYVAARQTTARTLQLANAVNAFTRGEYITRWQVVGHDEIARLGLQFNTMATRIERLMQELQAEQQRGREILQAQQELFARILHELHTPIMTMSTHLERLLDDTLSDQTHTQQLHVLDHHLNQIRSLIHDVFVLARSHTRHLSITLSPTHVHALIGRCIEIWRLLAWERHRVVLTATSLGHLMPQKRSRRQCWRGVAR
ncbi:MAG: hypothetical protein MI924_31535 [Chloroflexales bacterium]|nr:hypothetical protein [Chloroflexales bacterium]